MIVYSTVTDDRLERTCLDKQGGFINYDSDNLYPNKVKFLAKGSPSAMNCLKTFNRFVVGAGFTDPALQNFIVNKTKRTKAVDLLRKIVVDLCLFNGFAVHINYNALGEKVSLEWIPFETTRLGKPDDTGYINWIITNKDFYFDYKKENNIKFFAYDKANVIEQISQVVKKSGDFKKYRGQIYWFSMDGFGNYPESTIDAVASDCSTEDGLSNIRYRNVRFNFLPAGMLVKPGKSETAIDVEKQDTSATRYLDPTDDFASNFLKAQGDKNASKIILCEIQFGEEKPEFIEFPAHNFDKDFEVTQAACRHNIGSVFNQPPVLRGELISGKLGTSQEMNEAYNIYNNFTEDMRRQVSECFMELFNGFIDANFTDFSIKPLKYATSDGNVLS